MKVFNNPSSTKKFLYTLFFHQQSSGKSIAFVMRLNLRRRKTNLGRDSTSSTITSINCRISTISFFCISRPPSPRTPVLLPTSTTSAPRCFPSERPPQQPTTRRRSSDRISDHQTFYPSHHTYFNQEK